MIIIIMVIIISYMHARKLQVWWIISDYDYDEELCGYDATKKNDAEPAAMLKTDLETG